MQSFLLVTWTYTSSNFELSVLLIQELDIHIHIHPRKELASNLAAYPIGLDKLC